jgi:hypothetical protein
MFALRKRQYVAALQNRPKLGTMQSQKRMTQESEPKK